MNKFVILTSFVLLNKKEEFISHIVDTFGVSLPHVWIYEISTDSSRVLVTFKFHRDENFIDFKSISPNIIQVHKKFNCLYTINALNKLINYNNVDVVNNKNIKINWLDYDNTLLMTSNGKLIILPIKRIF